MITKYGRELIYKAFDTAISEVKVMKISFSDKEVELRVVKSEKVDIEENLSKGLATVTMEGDKFIFRAARNFGTVKNTVVLNSVVLLSGDDVVISKQDNMGHNFNGEYIIINYEFKPW